MSGCVGVSVRGWIQSEDQVVVPLPGSNPGRVSVPLCSPRLIASVRLAVECGINDLSS